MNISTQARSKLKAFAENLHPRYPKGHPLGGQFMPKGSADYKKAIAARIASKGVTTASAAVGGAIGGAVGGVVGNAVGAAVGTTLATVGKKLHSRIQEAKAKQNIANGENFMAIAKEAGAKFISDLKSPKFQLQLEKEFINVLASKAVGDSSDIVTRSGLADTAIAAAGGSTAGKFSNKQLRKVKKFIKSSRKDFENQTGDRGTQGGYSGSLRFA